MKLAISVALSHHSKLLVLDEATSGLDSVIREYSDMDRAQAPADSNSHFGG